MRLSVDEARSRMLTWLGLCRPLGVGAEGARAALARLRCVQLDPLDRIGTNADLVVRARVDRLEREGLFDALLPGHAFEHFAKERCLVPAARFPAYRARALQAPWWRLHERLERLDEGLIAEVLAEVRARGPLRVEDLAPRGRVEPLDWGGWKGTSDANRMAMEVLWTRTEVVVSGRRGRSKLYDLPERSLGAFGTLDPDAALDELVLDRAGAAGLLPQRLGPWWSGLRESRVGGRLERLAREGRLIGMELEGQRFWCLPEFLDLSIEQADERLRFLGPLDPLLWDRGLVRRLFEFDYTWEVYTPPARRRFGWYVVPLLHHGRLVGRMDAETAEGRVRVNALWEERPGSVEAAALEDALARVGVRNAAPPRPPGAAERSP